MLFQKEKKTTQPNPKKAQKKKKQQHIFMRIPYGNKAQQGISVTKYYFCGKPSLFPEAFSSAIFHCNSLPLTKVFGRLQTWVQPAAGLLGCCHPIGKGCQDHLIFALPFLRVSSSSPIALRQQHPPAQGCGQDTQPCSAYTAMMLEHRLH